MFPGPEMIIFLNPKLYVYYLFPTLWYFSILANVVWHYNEYFIGERIFLILIRYPQTIPTNIKKSIASTFDVINADWNILERNLS